MQKKKKKKKKHYNLMEKIKLLKLFFLLISILRVIVLRCIVVFLSLEKTFISITVC